MFTITTGEYKHIDPRDARCLCFLCNLFDVCELQVPLTLHHRVSAHGSHSDPRHRPRAPWSSIQRLFSAPCAAISGPADAPSPQAGHIHCHGRSTTSEPGHITLSSVIASGQCHHNCVTCTMFTLHATPCPGHTSAMFTPHANLTHQNCVGHMSRTTFSVTSMMNCSMLRPPTPSVSRCLTYSSTCHHCHYIAPFLAAQSYIWVKWLSSSSVVFRNPKVNRAILISSSSRLPGYTE